MEAALGTAVTPAFRCRCLQQLMFPACAEPLGWLEMFTVTFIPLKEERPLLLLCAIFNFVG